MKKVSGSQVVTTAEASELPLPAEIQDALGELVGAAREGLLALSVGLGLTVVHQLLEREVDEVVGPKGKHDPDRTAKRHGHEDGSMTLGGRRVPASRHANAPLTQHSPGSTKLSHAADRSQGVLPTFFMAVLLSSRTWV